MKCLVIVWLTFACALPALAEDRAGQVSEAPDRPVGFSERQQAQHTRLLAEMRSAETQNAAREELRKFYVSSVEQDIQVAEEVLLELARDEDHRLAASAIILLGMVPRERAKDCLIEVITAAKPDLRVLAAANALGRQSPTQEEAMRLFEAAKGIDRRIHGPRAMHGPQLEELLLRNIAASQGPDFFPIIKGYLDSPEATSGLSRVSILAATNAPEARLMLFDELKSADLTISSRGIQLMTLLRGTLVNGMESGDPDAKDMFIDFVEFVKEALVSPNSDPQVKEAAASALAWLVMRRYDDDEMQLERFVRDHESEWRNSRTADLIGSWLQRGHDPIREVDLLVPRDARPDITSLPPERRDLAEDLREGYIEDGHGSRVLTLYQSRDAAEVEVAEAVLWTLVDHEDERIAARAISGLASRPNARLKPFVIETIYSDEREPVMRAAMSALGRMELTGEEANPLFELAKGLDARILPESITRGTRLESDLLSALASNQGEEFHERIQAYLNSPEATPNLYETGILRAMDSPHARRVLLERLKQADVGASGATESYINSLGTSLARSIGAKRPEDAALLEEFIALLKDAVPSPDTHPKVKEAAVRTMAMLVMNGADSNGLHIRRFLLEHEHVWRETQHAMFIESWLNIGRDRYGEF